MKLTASMSDPKQKVSTCSVKLGDGKQLRQHSYPKSNVQFKILQVGMEFGMERKMQKIKE